MWPFTKRSRTDESTRAVLDQVAIAELREKLAAKTDQVRQLVATLADTAQLREDRNRWRARAWELARRMPGVEAEDLADTTEPVTACEIVSVVREMTKEHHPDEAYWEGVEARLNAITSDPLAEQVGGAHYKDHAIQPVEFIHKNRLNFLEGCVIKRVCRHRKKAGKQDLEKAIHELRLLIALEYPGE